MKKIGKKKKKNEKETRVTKAPFLKNTRDLEENWRRFKSRPDTRTDIRTCVRKNFSNKRIVIEQKNKSSTIRESWEELIYKIDPEDKEFHDILNNARTKVGDANGLSNVMQNYARPHENHP